MAKEGPHEVSPKCCMPGIPGLCRGPPCSRWPVVSSTSWEYSRRQDGAGWVGPSLKRLDEVALVPSRASPRRPPHSWVDGQRLPPPRGVSCKQSQGESGDRGICLPHVLKKMPTLLLLRPRAKEATPRTVCPSRPGAHAGRGLGHAAGQMVWPGRPPAALGASRPRRGCPRPSSSRAGWTSRTDQGQRAPLTHMRDTNKS